MKTTLAILSAVVVLASAAVFWIFIADTTRLHGDALGGHEENGRFYVADHGKTTEVSEEDWRRNRTLAITAFATFPLGMLGGFYLLFGVLFPRVVFRAPADERAARVRRVAASGPIVASTNCSGSFRWFSAGGRMIHADVHSAGLVLRVRLVGTAAVKRDEIRALREGRQFLIPFVEIEHSSAHVVSPIRLGSTKDAAFMDALRALAEQPQAVGRAG